MKSNAGEKIINIFFRFISVELWIYLAPLDAFYCVSHMALCTRYFGRRIYWVRFDLTLYFSRIVFLARSEISIIFYIQIPYIYYALVNKMYMLCKTHDKVREIGVANKQQRKRKLLKAKNKHWRKKRQAVSDNVFFSATLLGENQLNYFNSIT